jgi:eukaryotic-like serine/threonine-protein kinase
MSLTAGTRLGPYEILAPLGAGGMGEVYRARDTKLNRNVALKILPDAFASDADRLARFSREAQTLAALNHPSIAQIHGFEESGDVRALVMELVEGEDLSAVIARGPVPVSDALAITRQVALALETAHDAGIVHRDLKPANIKVKEDGTVKVLDFGLAKALDPNAGWSPGLSKSAGFADPSSNSPTMTSPAMTAMGMILGTAAYMSPEQAKGRAVNRRADIWAFGCVLYEALTGTRAFPGDDLTETLAAVVRGEPDWSLLPADLPPTVGVFLRRCFAKSAKDRVQDIGDMRLALEGAFDVPLAAGTERRPVSVLRQLRSLPFATVTVLLIAASGLMGWLLRPMPATVPQPLRQFTLTPSESLAIANSNRDMAITPDGSRLVYLAGQGAERTLYVRSLESLAPIALRKGERFFEPFVSPDNKWVAFNDESDFTLRKVPLAGGPPVTIASVGREISGATWGADDSIVFAFNGFESGLMQLSAGALSANVLTTPDKALGEVAHVWPEFLPDGQALIYTARSGVRGERSQIWALDLRTRTSKKLLETGTGAKYSATGHLLYGVENALWAVPFNAVTLEVHGEAVQLRPAVLTKSTGAVDFAVSAEGTLAYVTGSSSNTRRRLVWIDRATGGRQPVNLPERAYTMLRISPDGSRVALDIRDEESDIWIWDLARNVPTKITNDPSADTMPIWTPDSARVVFSSRRSGFPNLFVQPADGTGKAERLTEDNLTQYPSAVTRDGQVIYWEIGTETRLDVLMVPLAGANRTPVPLLKTTAIERNPELSPDGKWLAHSSDENQPAAQEIYVRPFPNVGGGRVQISSGGGMYPAWHPRTGNELFYVRPDGKLLAVPMRDGKPSGPARVVDGGFFVAPNPRSYDISPDGKRLLVIEDMTGVSGVSAQGMVVVLNWAEGLSRRPPASK